MYLSPRTCLLQLVNMKLAINPSEDKTFNRLQAYYYHSFNIYDVEDTKHFPQ